MKYGNHIIIFIFILFVYSCNKNNQNCDLISSPEIVSDNKETSSCYYSSYLTRMLNRTHLNLNPHPLNLSEETLFSSMENHMFLIPKTLKASEILATCENTCNDVSLNRIYESLLALKIKQNEEISKKISIIFGKIFHSMKNIIGESDFKESIHRWSRLKDSDITFPSLQRQELFIQPTKQLLTKERAMKYAINCLDKDNNPTPNTALQLDFLLYHAKGNDNKGLQGSVEKFKTERDYFFNALVRRMRGFRGNKLPANKTSYYGIVKFDIPELRAKDNSIPWRNWSRDSCINEPQSNFYTKSISKLQIPLACGISGTTNLALWSLFAFGTDLDENEMRLFLLSVWSTLSIDTGHALQEVLTASKLTAIYLRGLIKYPDPDYEYFRNRISTKTLESLERTTQLIRPLGDTNDEPKVTANWKTIHHKIYDLDRSVSPFTRKYDEPFCEYKSSEVNEFEKEKEKN